MSVEISSSDNNSTDSSDITSELFDKEKRPKSWRRRKYQHKYTRHDHWSKKKHFERSQKVSHEYIAQNLKIDNSQEKQTVTVNQSTIANSCGLMKYSTLDRAIPSDSGIFETDMSSSCQPPFFMARNPVVQTTGTQQQTGSEPCSKTELVSSK